MNKIERGTCPNCNEWGIEEDGECVECGWRIEYGNGVKSTKGGTQGGEKK